MKTRTNGWFNLGRALDKKGWSQAEFARHLDIRPQAVSRYWESGFDPCASTLVRWCAILECTLDELFDPKLKTRAMPRPTTARHYRRGYTLDSVSK